MEKEIKHTVAVPCTKTEIEQLIVNVSVKSLKFPNRKILNFSMAVDFYRSQLTTQSQLQTLLEVLEQCLHVFRHAHAHRLPKAERQAFNSSTSQ